MEEPGDRYWEWRDALLRHPDGRANGGEPCVVCGGNVPPNTDWRHRDRHVCGSRCNSTLSRRLNRQLKKGVDFGVPKPDPVPDPRIDTRPMVFGMSLSENGEPLFGHLGFGPLPGDVIVRYGVATSFARLDAPTALALTRGLSDNVVVAAHESGWLLVAGADAAGRPTRTLYRRYGPDGVAGGMFEPFTDADGRSYRFASEVIRDVDEQGRDVDWQTFVAVPAEVEHPAVTWTEDYQRRSEHRHRASTTTARHARRVRIEGAAVERFDPLEVYERDAWTCQLCGAPVDRTLRFPDLASPSLDHVIPLVAGGEHSRANTQLAHWLCNVRKGGRTPDLD